MAWLDMHERALDLVTTSRLEFPETLFVVLRRRVGYLRVFKCTLSRFGQLRVSVCTVGSRTPNSLKIFNSDTLKTRYTSFYYISKLHYDGFKDNFFIG